MQDDQDPMVKPPVQPGEEGGAAGTGAPAGDDTGVGAMPPAEGGDEQMPKPDQPA
jgi:hypothetical protein